jgi:hypothetical protein
MGTHKVAASIDQDPRHVSGAFPHNADGGGVQVGSGPRHVWGAQELVLERRLQEFELGRRDKFGV